MPLMPTATRARCRAALESEFHQSRGWDHCAQHPGCCGFSRADCRTFVGEIGIVGTPVIDGSNATLYVVARTKEPLPPPNNQTFVHVQRLHALDIATGIERSNSPVVINATVPGTGDGSSGGFIQFDSGATSKGPVCCWSTGSFTSPGARTATWTSTMGGCSAIMDKPCSRSAFFNAHTKRTAGRLLDGRRWVGRFPGRRDFWCHRRW
jgi:hypothetical protein